ncbi:MAG: GHKL domain-containing protein [Candidatus Omnitrophica bacterium]|nr:GHKL domain-containing protein [Candidatus Omnitrophota bacterium]
MNPYDKRRKRILKRILVGVTLFVLSFSVLGVLGLLLGNSFLELGDGNPLIWVLLTTLLAVLGYQPVDQLYGWLFRQVFFPRRSHLLQILNHLTQDLTGSYDLTELSNFLVNTLGEVLQFKTVSLLVRAPRGEGYVITSAYGWNVSDYRKLRIQANNPLLELMKAAPNQVLVREKVVRSLTWQEANGLTSQFEAFHATCVIPLWVKTELIGSINLLTPSSNRPIDEGDLRCFRDFAGEVAKSIHGALILHELKEQNEELRDTQSQLLQAAKLAAIEQLASGIAHEIHNPLTIISGKAQVLLLQKDRKFYDEKVEEVLKTIVKQTKRAADITRKLLMFSQASASLREKLRLETVLDDTISLIAYQTSLEGTKIQRHIGQELPDFFGNVQELREVFLNLILNALQATGPGGEIQIGMTYQKADKIFVIQVSDNGPGILQENLEKVFNPFFTTRSEGAGLGLFVTQQIVNRYGGSIRVESEAGQGTLFVIELPYEEPPALANADSANSEIGGEEEHDTFIGGR